MREAAILLFSTPLKFSFLIILIPSFLVIINAVLSAKELGGELGMGLKKVAAGTISYVILYVTIIAKELLPFETMTDAQARVFFVFANLLASLLLITGFYQMYKISKKLKLF